ncbi:Hypothetical predicted protein [Podarcis lilfordi]|uniref:Uncharacterized protein n=1 Tax=Podarcis lilfordi TaxID=74358 RepID=A0AA35KN70_9SAUR|nr:Hypothetical predicted protein [Podarcis lilfordi]
MNTFEGFCTLACSMEDDYWVDETPGMLLSSNSTQRCKSPAGTPTYVSESPPSWMLPLPRVVPLLLEVGRWDPLPPS